MNTSSHQETHAVILNNIEKINNPAVHPGRTITVTHEESGVSVVSAVPDCGISVSELVQKFRDNGILIDTHKLAYLNPYRYLEIPFHDCNLRWNCDWPGWSSQNNILFKLVKK